MRTTLVLNSKLAMFIVVPLTFFANICQVGAERTDSESCADTVRSTEAKKPETLGNLLGRYQDRVILERGQFPAPAGELTDIAKLPEFRSGRGIFHLVLRAPDNSRLIIQESILEGAPIFFQVDPQGNVHLRKLKGSRVRSSEGSRFEKFYFEDGYELDLPPAGSPSPIGLVPSHDDGT